MYVWRRRFPNSLAIIIHTFNYYHEKGLRIMDFPNPFLSKTPEGSSIITIVVCCISRVNAFETVSES